MYVARANWSQPEGTDPAPCFRQGDLVRIRWVHMDHSLVVNTLHAGISERLPVAELREELVVLVGTCCDLVLHPNPKRKGVQISPLREVPKNIRSDATLLEALKMTAERAQGTKTKVPVNLFYFAAGESHPEGVAVLEAMSMVDFATLRRSTKLAELTASARMELRERIKSHFTRGEP